LLDAFALLGNYHQRVKLDGRQRRQPQDGVSLGRLAAPRQGLALERLLKGLRMQQRPPRSSVQTQTEQQSLQQVSLMDSGQLQTLLAAPLLEYRMSQGRKTQSLDQSRMFLGWRLATKFSKGSRLSSGRSLAT
jgi:hypothetical protein